MCIMLRHVALYYDFCKNVKNSTAGSRLMLWWTIKKLKSSDTQAKIAAAKELGATKENRGVPSLIEGLKDESEPVRIACARALGQIGHPAGVEPLVCALRAGKKRNAAEKGDGAESYVQVLTEALAGAGALDQLAGLLASEDREVRRWAARALGLMRDSRAVEPLCIRLDDARAEVRKAAIQALEEIADPAAVPALVKTLSNRDPETRQAAVRALGILADPASGASLAAAVRDPDEGVQLASLAALSRVGGAHAVAGLNYALECGRKNVRDAASKLLESGTIAVRTPAERAALAVAASDFQRAAAEGEAAVDALQEALTSRDGSRRLQAALTLGRLRAERSIPALLRLLKDHDAKVREGAADALACLGLAAVEGLVSELQSYDPVVQSLAARALGRIGGMDAAKALEEFATGLPKTVTGGEYSEELARHVEEALELIRKSSVPDDQNQPRD